MNGHAHQDHEDASETPCVPALADPDAYFSMLADACRDLNASQGHLFHAQLVLLLIHHVADLELLREAIGIARRGLDLVSVTN